MTELKLIPNCFEPERLRKLENSRGADPCSKPAREAAFEEIFSARSDDPVHPFAGLAFLGPFKFDALQQKPLTHPIA
jgi:hypothetical protein